MDQVSTSEPEMGWGVFQEGVMLNFYEEDFSREYLQMLMDLNSHKFI